MPSASLEPSRRVLVTGAAGFVGRRVCEALSASGWRVTGLDRLSPPLANGFPRQPLQDFWTDDLLDHEALARRRPAAPFAAIVHLAGVLPGTATPDQLMDINAGGTAAVLDCFGGSGCHFVLFSTGLVYGKQVPPFRESMECLPADPYAESKLAAEAVARLRSKRLAAPLTILRPAVLYGQGAPAGMLLNTLLATLRKGEPFAMTAGEQVRDFLHVDDAIAALGAILERRAAGVWNLGSGQSWTVLEAARLAADIAGRPDLLRVGQLPYRTGEVFDYRLDISAVTAALAWQPRVDLPAGLRRLWKDLA